MTYFTILSSSTLTCLCKVHAALQLIIFTYSCLAILRQPGNWKADKVKGHWSPRGQSRVSGAAGPGSDWRQKGQRGQIRSEKGQSCPLRLVKGDRVSKRLC